jgi:hypothetical protein
MFHCFNVTQTLFYFLQGLNCKEIFCAEEMLVSMLAALCHDLDHPGLNNKFHTQCKTKLFQQFHSSPSVLEHHHYSQAAVILQRKECNILQNMDDEYLTEINILLKKAILATDLALHRSTMTEIDLRAADVLALVNKDTDLEMDIGDDVDDAISIGMICLLKCADISNEIRKKDIASKWATLVNQEFTLQVNFEEEKGLQPFIPMSVLQNIPLEQINFIERLCLPFF